VDVLHAMHEDALELRLCSGGRFAISKIEGRELKELFSTGMLIGRWMTAIDDAYYLLALPHWRFRIGRRARLRRVT
jgi:hypothetical protein